MSGESDSDSPENNSPLVVGQVHSGPVVSVKRFGVFVAIGGIEGLVDAWWLQENDQVWPKLGDIVKVCIETVRDDGKIGLSLVS